MGILDQIKEKAKAANGQTATTIPARTVASNGIPANPAPVAASGPSVPAVPVAGTAVAVNAPVPAGTDPPRRGLGALLMDGPGKTGLAAAIMRPSLGSQIMGTAVKTIAPQAPGKLQAVIEGRAITITEMPSTVQATPEEMMAAAKVQLRADLEFLKANIENKEQIGAIVRQIYLQLRNRPALSTVLLDEDYETLTRGLKRAYSYQAMNKTVKRENKNKKEKLKDGFADAMSGLGLIDLD